MTATSVSHSDLIAASAADVRAAIRNGAYDGHTAGLAAGKLQCNLAILPERYALDFLRFCQRNPKPCPIVGVSDTGDPILPTLGHDIDIRTDVPKYRVFREWTLSDEVTDISDLWADDLVTVALGCSFTFENALMRNGIPVRHIETGRNVPMFRSNIDLVPAGRFGGQMVVTMRPIPEASGRTGARDQPRAIPQAHGAPIAIGDPAADRHCRPGAARLGRCGRDQSRRSAGLLGLWGDPAERASGCGTALCITHSPGHMLISDVAEDAETTILTTKLNDPTRRSKP